MKKIQSTFLMALLLVYANTIAAQNSDVDKKISKAEKLIESGKAEEAEELMMSVVAKYPDAYKAWNTLTTAQMYVYDQKKEQDKLLGNMTITTKDKDGNEIKDDSLARQFKDLMMSIRPSETYKRHMLNTGRVATCVYRWAHYPAMLIRINHVDGPLKTPDAAAVKQFNLAEKEFQQRNFTTAAKYYRKAIEIDSTYYKAKLYLGDVYYATKYYNLAIPEFKAAVATRPDLVEPRKYLIDALIESNQYDVAYDECVEAMMVYPDLSLMDKIESTVHKQGNSKYDLHWIARGVFPNKLKPVKEEKGDLPLKLENSEHWKYYTEALDKVKTYTDDKGLLSANSITKEKYLEVYSWDYMLSKSNAPELEFARKMKEKGYLDCYVMLSNFHYDLLDQYKDFVAANRDKIKGYFELLKVYQ